MTRDEEIGINDARRANRSRVLVCAVLAVLATCADMIRATTGLNTSALYVLNCAAYWVLFMVVFTLGSRAMDWLSAASPDTDSAWSLDPVGTAQTVKPVYKAAKEGPHAGWRSWLTTLRAAVADGIAVPTHYTVRGIARISGIIMLCWSPMIILLYPGVLWYDSRQQLLQFFHLPNRFTDGALSDHHPVFDTMIYGAFTRLGIWLGSADLGIFLLSIAQAACTAVALACMAVLVRRCGATSRGLTLMLALLCFVPQMPAYAAAICKDATFLPWFALFSVAVVETMRSQGKSLHRPLPVIALCTTALLSSLTRKTGVLLVIMVCLAAVIVLLRTRRYERGLWRQCGRTAAAWLAAVIALCTCTMGVIMPMIVLPALGAEPGGKQEMMGLMFQQSARLMREYDGELPEWQKTAITNALGENVTSRYSWWITDTVKGGTWDEAKDGTLPAYLHAWAAGLLAHPANYAQTYLAVQIGWYAMPNLSDGNTVMCLTPIDAHEMNHAFSGSSDIGFTWTDTTVGAGVESVISWAQGTPIGMFFGAKAFWSTWMLAFLVCECRRRAPERMVWLAPLIVANLVLWIAPTSVTYEAMRYLLPLFYLVPASLALVAASPSRITPED